MITVASDLHRLHHGVELNDGVIMACWESPARADLVRERVEAVGLGPIIDARPHEVSDYGRVHAARYLAHLESAWDLWHQGGFDNPALPLVWPVHGMRGDVEPEHIEGRLGYFAMDASCSFGPSTWQAVRSSADTALTAAKLLATGQAAAFALCRPPGHHAGHAFAGGYCYLNNASIAAQSLRDAGLDKVAILDVDFHHGNGTQQIFYDRDDVHFASLHGDPRVCYPYFLGFADERGVGAGEGFTANYPLAPGTDWAGYAPALDHALAGIARFTPDALVVSLGVDTFEHDPISQLALRTDDYLRLGAAIARVAPRTLFVFEGGYAVDDIGVNAVNVLLGFEQAS